MRKRSKHGKAYGFAVDYTVQCSDGQVYRTVADAADAAGVKHHVMLNHINGEANYETVAGKVYVKCYSPAIST